MLAVEGGGRRRRFGGLGEQCGERGRERPVVHGWRGPQRREPLPALADRGLLPGQVGVEFLQYVGELAPGVVREDVAHLVEAQPQLGEPAHAGQQDGVAHAVRAVASPSYRWEVPPAPLRLREQPDVVVVPDGPGGDPDQRGDLSDPHGVQ